MPLLNSTFTPPPFLKNGHIQTIYPNLFRKITFKKPRIEEITTPDNDFLELEWYEQGSHQLAVLLHGLEGNAQRTYMLGMARELYTNGYDVLCWNFRSCGSRINNQLRFYHSGDTDDIHTVLTYVRQLNIYKSIGLVGFSMGGNVILKYLGEQSNQIYPEIICAATFSVPVDLKSSGDEMRKWKNKLYMNHFIRKLRKKVIKKQPKYPQQLSLDNYSKIKNFKDFDDAFTAPIHGFKSAEDYWEKASSLKLLDKIRIPTLLVNAKNDSFLGPSCYPKDIAAASKYLFLEMPESGGHVGFMNFSKTYWSEKRAREFLDCYLTQITL